VATGFEIYVMTFRERSARSGTGPIAPNVGGPTTLAGAAIADQTPTQEREHHVE
jgi:hypothetical protein